MLILAHLALLQPAYGAAVTLNGARYCFQAVLPEPRGARDRVAAAVGASDNLGAGCADAVVALYRAARFSNVSVEAKVDIADQSRAGAALLAFAANALVVTESRVRFAMRNATQQNIYGVAPLPCDAELRLVASNITYEQLDAASSAKSAYGVSTAMAAPIYVYNTTITIITQMQEGNFYGVTSSITHMLNLTNSELHMQNAQNASDILLFGMAEQVTD